jgi:hypothetical protein
MRATVPERRRPERIIAVLPAIGRAIGIVPGLATLKAPVRV